MPRARPLLPAGVAMVAQMVKCPEHVAREALRSYFELLEHEAITRPQRWSVTTRALAAMRVGEIRHFQGKGTHVLRQRCAYARRLMENPRARWSMESIADNEVRVTRRPDGDTRERDETKNPVVCELLTLAPGESLLSAWVTSGRGAGALTTYHKVMARRRLGEPNAQWAARVTSKGVRITRTR